MFQNIDADDRSSIGRKEADVLSELATDIRYHILLADDDSNDTSIVVSDPDWSTSSVEPTDKIIVNVFAGVMLGLDIVDDVQVKGTVIDNTFIFAHDLDAIEIDEIKDQMIGVDELRNSLPDEFIERLEQKGGSL